MAQGPGMKNALGKLLSGVLNVYLVVAFLIFVPYYNWQLAKSQGFFSWLMLGQVVPTLQALVWPYYVYVEYRQTKAGTTTPPPIVGSGNSGQ